MSEHTPGPWMACVGNGSGSFWIVHHKTDTEDGGYFGRVEALHSTEEARETARANAKLIGAAPDLLAACELVVKCYKGTASHEQVPAWEAVNAAIHKAKGEGNGTA